MRAIDKFWKRAEPILVRCRSPEDILNKGHRFLRKVDGRLGLECSLDDVPRELVLTAGGDAELFALVDKIVSRAPQTPGWRFIALKPPLGFDFELETPAGSLNLAASYFMPLESASNPSAIGLRFAFESVVPERSAVALAVATGLGERVAAQHVGYVDVVAMPADPEAAGYLKTSELKDYVSWWTRQSA